MEPLARTSTMIFASLVIVVVIAVAASGLAFSPANSLGKTATFSVSPPNGIQLNLVLNSTSFSVGQKLNVTVSIVNALPSVYTIKPANNWQFLGVPVALWPPCYFGLPMQMVVLQGNYTLQGLQAIANVQFNYMCMEAVNIDHIVFQPMSDQASLTGIYDVTSSNQTLGPFRLEQNFTTGGYWKLQSLAGELNIPIIGDGGNPSVPPDSTPFAPGTYTVAVADEWGQAVIAHFTVYS